MSGQVMTFFEALYVRGLARQLLCILGSLEDVDPELRDQLRGCRYFLADAVELMDPESAGILRGERRSSFADRLLEARKVAL